MYMLFFLLPAFKVSSNLWGGTGFTSHSELINYRYKAKIFPGIYR